MSLAPDGARALFGEALPLVEEYARLLAGPGVTRGMLGPREADRIWDRHLINCAAIAEILPRGASVVDIGSGAGLPGIVLAIVRTDLSITLLEPLLRRTVFLDECIGVLALRNVSVWRARAEEIHGKVAADVVTARAVAPLERLAKWALPLLRPHGELIALKGERAQLELDQARPSLQRRGIRSAEVISVGGGRVDPPPTVVRVVAGGQPEGQRNRSSARRNEHGRGRKR